MGRACPRTTAPRPFKESIAATGSRARKPRRIHGSHLTLTLPILIIIIIINGMVRKTSHGRFHPSLFGGAPSPNYRPRLSAARAIKGCISPTTWTTTTPSDTEEVWMMSKMPRLA